MSFLDSLLSPGRMRSLNRQADKYGQQQSDAYSSLNSLIKGLKDRAGNTAPKTLQELYGPQIQHITDQIAGNTGSATDALGRIAMARGGDLTGSTAANISRLTQGENQSMANIIDKFTQLRDRYNQNQQSRGDQLLSNATGAQQNVYSMLSSLLNNVNLRKAQLSTANQQFGLDTVGAATSAASLFV